MFCKKCGTQFNGRFCPNCGDDNLQQNVNNNGFQNNDNIYDPYAQAQTSSPPKPFYKKTLFIIVVSVVAFLIVVNLVSSMLPKSETDGTKNSTRQTKITTGGGYAPTMGEKNALKSAKSYLNVMAFSYTGLIEQLEFEGYSSSEAKYGADNCGANWNEQAAKKAKEYLKVMSYSRSGLINQLEFEGFTTAQAEYGVNAVGY